MAADPRQGPSVAQERRLSVEEARFYASVYGDARKGSLGELCRTGCSEEEAEEFFARAFEKVMNTVDPIARGFTPPQMVNFVKRSAWRCMVDSRRQRGQRPELELGAVRSLSDPSAEDPDEVVEARETVAIGLEALQMLPERDRLIFRQRHQMGLAPEEILHNMPGLSRRTYRKVLQRANAKVLGAFARIEGGERCQEMEGGLLRRYVAGESPEAERLAIAAHLAHCQGCRRAQAQMHGYLIDVAGAVIAMASAMGSGRLGGLNNLPARFAELVANSAQGVIEASRAARERAREVLLRIASGMPGSGGDATVGQAVTASSVKVAATCATAVATGTCIAAGLVPGIGGIGLLNQHHSHGQPPAKSATRAAPTSSAGLVSTPRSAAPAQESNPQPAHPHSRRSTTSAGQSAAASNSPSSARESGSVTGSEFGAESSQSAPSPTSSPSSAPSVSSGTTSSGGGGSSAGQGGSSSQGSSSEFGL